MSVPAAPDESLCYRTPRSAYVHVPFCQHHCGYCNFTVITGRPDLVDDYLRAIELELQQLGSPQPVETLFLGGGTPTHLPQVALERLLKLLNRWLPVRTDEEQVTGEYSVEANPGDLDAERVELLAAYGVNRVSLGAQSFQGQKLARLERSHTAEDVRATVSHVREHIVNVALDLIFAAPSEGLDEWRFDLESAIGLAPTHVSTYGLTFEKGTTFWGRLRRGSLSEVDEEVQRVMYLAAIHELQSAGYLHYEVSNFARPHHACRHNLAYWNGRTFWGIGPGATRFVRGRRETNQRSTTGYIRSVLAGKSPVAEVDSVSPEQYARERLVFGLRQIAGVSLGQLQEETGFDVRQLVSSNLDRLVSHGLLDLAGDRLRLTEEGLLVSDSMWPYFL